jgi:hypothetical protein
MDRHEQVLNCLRDFCRQYQIEIAQLKTEVDELKSKLIVPTQEPELSQFGSKELQEMIIAKLATGKRVESIPATS